MCSIMSIYILFYGQLAISADDNILTEKQVKYIRMLYTRYMHNNCLFMWVDIK